MRPKAVWILIFPLYFFFIDLSFAGEDARVFSRGVQFARAGQKDFAYMEFRAIVRDYPRSKFHALALFATGEHLFLANDPQQAQGVFQNYVTSYPDAKGRIFALAYLWKIAQIQEDEISTEQSVREIVNLKQISLIFRKSQEYKYHSPMNSPYLAVIHIDHIEIFTGGSLFAKIPY
jgi:hypothetical protein